MKGFESVAFVGAPKGAQIPGGQTAVAVFQDLKAATEAVKQLDGSTYKGRALRCRIDREVRGHVLETGTTLIWETQSSHFAS